MLLKLVPSKIPMETLEPLFVLRLRTMGKKQTPGEWHSSQRQGTWDDFIGCVAENQKKKKQSIQILSLIFNPFGSKKL